LATGWGGGNVENQIKDLGKGGVGIYRRCFLKERKKKTGGRGKFH